jgi:large subunit ribosomal protein L20
MVRIKRGTTAHKRRKNVLKKTKGFRWGRKSKYRLAKEAVLHAFSYSFAGRKRKKRDFRRLWQVQISASLKNVGLSYSQFINQLKKKGIALDRKILANLANERPEIFSRIIKEIKG